MEQIPFVRLNMLLNLGLTLDETEAYRHYIKECQELAHKMRCEFEATGEVTPTMLSSYCVKMPYPVFYENKSILPYLDLEQKEHVIGIKVQNLTLYKNALRSKFFDIKKRIQDLSKHFGFPLQCPGELDLRQIYAEKATINAVAQLMRQYDIDFTPIKGNYWYQSSPIDTRPRYLNMDEGKQQQMPKENIKLRPIIVAELFEQEKTN